MRKQRLFGYGRLLLLAAVIFAVGTPAAFAQTSTSSNYKMTESQFGSSSNQQNCSTQYCATTSIGDLGAGVSKGVTSTASFGSVTPNVPSLDVIVDTGVTNLGTLTAETTATKTSIVRVSTYLSSGYTLQITGSPPKYGNHTLKTPTTPTASTPGVEQFAINVTANSTPGVGAGPIQVPSNQFSFGEVTDNYKIANQFKYVDSDVVARSLSASGRTDYTISMIVNIANNTPAGHYVGEFAAVVIPIF